MRPAPSHTNSGETLPDGRGSDRPGKACRMSPTTPTEARTKQMPNAAGTAYSTKGADAVTREPATPSATSAATTPANFRPRESKAYTSSGPVSAWKQRNATRLRGTLRIEVNI